MAASAPIPWPLKVNERNQRWSLIERPGSDTRVWIGSLGGVIWGDRDEKMKNELATLEERTCPGILGDALQEKLDALMLDGERGLSQFVHGIIAELPPDTEHPDELDVNLHEEEKNCNTADEPAVMPRVKGKCSGGFTRWH